MNTSSSGSSVSDETPTVEIRAARALLPWVTIALIAFLGAMLVMTLFSVNRLATVLEQRSPIMEYMVCQDDYYERESELKKDRDSAQTNFLFALVAAAVQHDTIEGLGTDIELENARQALADAEANYRNQPDPTCPTDVGPVPTEGD